MNSYVEPDFNAIALLTIDVQRDFISGGRKPSAEKEVLVPAIVRLVRAFRRAKRPVIHVVRVYKPDGSNVDICRRQKVEEGCCLLEPDSDGVQLVRDLLPDPNMRLDCDRLLTRRPQRIGSQEYVLYKSRFGAFYRTSLGTILDDMCVRTLAFAGFNFPNCPRASMYEASERDYRILAVEDAISNIYERGRSELRDIGVSLMTVEEVEAALTEK